jgi:predicted RNA methylase
MRYRYYGSCAPGLEACIAEVLGERLPDLKIPLLLSGALVFETSASYDRLNLFCFNNVFRVISIVTDTGGQKKNEPAREASKSQSPQRDLEKFVRAAIAEGTGEEIIRGLAPALPGMTEAGRHVREAGRNVQEAGRGARDAGRSVPKAGRPKAGRDVREAGRSVPKAKPGGAGFRVIFSQENVPAAVDNGLRREAETYIASLSGMRINRSKPEAEFWFLRRREGFFFMKRLSRHPAWDKTLHPGELPPPLAWMLCKLADPKNNEKILDPFCGYGSIPEARLRHFPPGEFFASDTDPKALAFSKNKFGKFNGKTPAASRPKHLCHFNRIDVRELGRIIPPASIDSIVTDPPWGFYQKTFSRNGESGMAGTEPGVTDTEPGMADTEPGGPEPSRAGEFYAHCFKVFAGLLKPGGRAVILCGRGGKPDGAPSVADELLQAAEQNGFTVVRSVPILVSGRKAVIFSMRAGSAGISGAPAFTLKA